MEPDILPNDLRPRAALESDELLSKYRPILNPLAKPLPIGGVKEPVVLDKTNRINLPAVLTQDGRRASDVVAVTVRCKQRRKPTNSHSLQELQRKETVACAAVDNYGRSIPGNDDLARALPDVEKKDLHCRSPLRPPLTILLKLLGGTDFGKECLLLVGRHALWRAAPPDVNYA